MSRELMLILKSRYEDLIKYENIKQKQETSSDIEENKTLDKLERVEKSYPTSNKIETTEKSTNVGMNNIEEDRVDVNKIEENQASVEKGETESKKSIQKGGDKSYILITPTQMLATHEKN